MHMNDFTLSPFLLTPDGDHRHCELSLQSSPIRHYMVRMSLLLLLLLCTGMASAQQVEVTLTEAGTLSEKIASDQKFEISSLKVSGPINGTDVRYLREMAGRDVKGYSTGGRLVDLNLSDAKIVEGGESYCSYNGVYYENNKYNYINENELGKYAFIHCLLRNIKLPNLMTHIGDRAFMGCSKLNNVAIPSSVTNIGNSVFSGCTSLNRLKIEDRNTSLYLPKFSDCPLDSVYIGGDISGTPFSNNTNLKYVEMSRFVTRISDGEFYKCSSLKQISIPNTVTYIGGEAFRDCSSLESVNIPDSLTDICDYTFHGCRSLKKISFPRKVKSVGMYAFLYCDSLKSIVIEDRDSILAFNAYSFGGSPSNRCDAEYLYVGGDFSGNPFRNAYRLRNVELSDKVTKISDYEFSWCQNLQTISVPNSVKSIGKRAFYQCNSLRGIKLPNKITRIEDETFYHCYNLNSIVIPSSVIEIGKDAFDGCRIAKAFWLPNTPPEGVNNLAFYTNIDYVSNDKYSFSGRCYPFLSSMFESNGIVYIPVDPSERTCDAVDFVRDTTYVDVNVEKTVTYRGIEFTVNNVNPYCFYDDEFIKSVKMESFPVIDYCVFSGCENLQKIVIPNIVTTLGKSAFAGCKKLAELTIGTGVKTINGGTFSGCSSLTNISIPENVDSIGNGAFSGCSSLENFIIEDRNTDLRMGTQMFSDCPLKSVYIGGNITYPSSERDGYSPFCGLTSLERVEITDKETEISDKEFFGCKSLKDVVLGDGIEKIGSYAFSGCTSLESFSFGESLKTIGDEAFSDCTAMTKLMAKTHEPPVCGSQALDDINKWECKLYVPIDREDAYKAAEQWKEFFFIDGSIETGIEKVEKDGNSEDAHIYGLDGIRKMHLQKGINIIRMNNGTTRKIIAK